MYMDWWCWGRNRTTRISKSLSRHCVIGATKRKMTVESGRRTRSFFTSSYMHTLELAWQSRTSSRLVFHTMVIIRTKLQAEETNPMENWRGKNNKKDYVQPLQCNPSEILLPAINASCFVHDSDTSCISILSRSCPFHFFLPRHKHTSLRWQVESGPEKIRNTMARGSFFMLVQCNGKLCCRVVWQKYSYILQIYYSIPTWFFHGLSATW